jgi:hypothetical protein
MADVMCGTIVAIEVKWKLYTNAPTTRRGWLEWQSLFDMELMFSTSTTV